MWTIPHPPSSWDGGGTSLSWGGALNPCQLCTVPTLPHSCPRCCTASVALQLRGWSCSSVSEGGFSPHGCTLHFLKLSYSTCGSSVTGKQQFLGSFGAESFHWVFHFCDFWSGWEKWVCFPQFAPRLMWGLCDYLPEKHVCPRKGRSGMDFSHSSWTAKNHETCAHFFYGSLSSSVKLKAVTVCGLLGHTIKLSDIWSN